TNPIGDIVARWSMLPIARCGTSRGVLGRKIARARLLRTNVRPASVIRRQRLRTVRWRSDREPRLPASQRECQTGNNEGREKDRQRPLSAASEGNNVALGGVEGPSSAGVSAIADLQGVTSRFDWYLDRLVQFDRPGTLTVNDDVVRG